MPDITADMFIGDKQNAIADLLRELQTHMSIGEIRMAIRLGAPEALKPQNPFIDKTVEFVEINGTHGGVSVDGEQVFFGLIDKAREWAKQEIG